MPTYLRFVTGVIDSTDLPLNVSREILQESRDVKVIRESSTKRVLSMLEELASSDDAAKLEKYRTFWILAILFVVAVAGINYISFTVNTSINDTVGAVGLALTNTMVVDWWTSSAIQWNFAWDLLLGAMLMATTCSRCFVGLFGVAGNLRPVRNLYLIEAVVFIAAGVPAAAWFGIPGLLGAALGTQLLVTLTFSIAVVPRVVGSVASLTGPALFAVGLFAAVALTAVFLPRESVAHTLVLAGPAVLLFSCAAGLTILSQETKDRILCMVRRVVRLRISGQ
jgi:hypothetical protein